MKFKVLLIFFVCITEIFAQSDSTRNTIMMDEVVVTGTKLGIARNQVPFTVSQISSEQIFQSGETSLLSVIAEYIPGIFVTKRGITGYGLSTGSAGQINIRGTGGNPNTEVLVMVNGNPQFAGLFGHPLPDTYLSSDVEKVEIIRGPASILYGSNAMGGVINIITKKQTIEGFRSNSRMMYGSYNTAKLMLSSGFKQDNFGFIASVNHERTDGHRPSSDFRLTNGYLQTGYEFDNHFNLSLDMSIAKIKSSDPGEASTGKPGEKIDILRTNSNLTFNNEFGFTSGALHIFYNYGEHDVTDGFFSIDRNYGLALYQTIKLFVGNVITAGFDFKEYGGIARNVKAMNGLGIILGDTTVNEKAGYILIQQTFFERLVVNLGFRFEYHSVFGSENVPSAGVAYYLSDNTTLKTSVSKGFRSPTIRELFLFPPANDELKPERVTNYEIGLMQKLFSNMLGVELTLFKSDGINLIQTIFTGGAPKNVNSGKFSNWGVELSTKLNPTNSMNYILNYTYINQDTPILATPEHSLYIGTNYSIGNFQIHFGLQNITNLCIVTTPEIKKENYSLLNSNLLYKFSHNFEIFIKAENILDTDYQINYDYPMPGITFMSGINLSL
ncbi:MAG: TonB-dependent receptor [bacterium]